MRKLFLALIVGGALAALPVAAQSSNTVKEAQQALKDKGFDPGPIDGIDGPKTHAAIRDFQKSQSLTADGKLGPKTMSVLGVKGTADGDFAASGSTLKHSYTKGAGDMAQGGKQLGHDVTKGEVVQGGKQFGEDVGKGAKKMGVGTAHAAEDAGKGIKKTFENH